MAPPHERGLHFYVNAAGSLAALKLHVRCILPVILTTTALLMAAPVLYVSTVQAADRAWQMIQQQDVFEEIEVRIGGRHGFTAVRSADGAWSVRRTAPVAHTSRQEAPAALPPAH